MNKEQKMTVKLMNFLDKIDELEYSSNFLWALQTSRMPTWTESAIWEFTGESTFIQAVRALLRADELRKGVKYPNVAQKEVTQLVAKINKEWKVRS
jgi:hypothetical protein